jgi:hypothetical protein
MPLTITLNVPDYQADNVTTVNFVSVTVGISATGTISVYSVSDYHLLVDDDGNGTVDRDIAATTVLTKAVDFSSPSPITDLSVLTSALRVPVLTWTAPGDDGPIGTPAAYDIRYHTIPITDANWISAALAISPLVPSVAGTTERFTVTEISGGIYYFAIRSIDDVFQYSALSNMVQVEIPYHLFLPLVLRNH